jgi:bacillaene synthase trans-acting acyltransferase
MAPVHERFTSSSRAINHLRVYGMQTFRRAFRRRLLPSRARAGLSLTSPMLISSGESSGHLETVPSMSSVQITSRAARKVFMFSGQGSHYFQMGRALYERESAFRYWMQRLDGIARDVAGYSVVEPLYDERNAKSDVFDQTRLTHPAIFMVEYALARHLIESGIEPDMTLGASLGMFAAAAISGHVTPEDALLAVLRQVDVFESSCCRGSMVAVLADRSHFETCSLDRYSDLAAENFDSHFVVSAPETYVREIEDVLRGRQITFQKLAVGFAYHSRWIEPARGQFQQHMQSLQSREAVIPIACCARAEVLRRLPEGHFWNVVRDRIRFGQTLRALEHSSPHLLLDLGPAGTLATFARYALPPDSRSRAFAILSPFGREMENLAALRRVTLS